MPTTYNPRQLQASKLPHPTCFELKAKFKSLGKIMDNIFDIADQDLVITVTDSGEPDMTANYQLSRCMLKLSESLFGLAEQCSEKADALTDQVNRYRDQNADSHKVQFLTEITNPALKDALCQLRTPLPVKRTGEYVTWQVKQEGRPVYVSDGEDSDEEQIIFGGDPDTRFSKTKENANDEEQYQYKCGKCEKVLRSLPELRNHASDHSKEFYTCLKCLRSLRTYASFKKHRKTHYTDPLKCPTCGDVFKLQSSLTNHRQKHEKKLKCDKKDCGKEFQYRQAFLDHRKHGHLPTKTVKCPLCSGMFQTRGSMHTHKWKYHGHVKSIVKGYSQVPQDN